MGRMSTDHDFNRTVGLIYDRMKPMNIPVHTITGRTADKVGALALSEAAKRQDLIIIIKGKSRYHTGKIFGRLR